MTVVGSWLRLELRRRWRALAVLALLIALAAGTVLTAVAGARRGASAIDRLAEVTLPATAVVRPVQSDFDWAKVRALPQVESLTTFPGYAGFGIDEAPANTVQLYLPADADAMSSIERPVVIDGRLADPARADEAVVTANFARTYGRGVGDSVTLRLFTPEQVDAGLSGVRTTPAAQPAGPAVRVRIVGVIRSPWFSDRVGDPGTLYPPVGLVTRYRANVLGAAGDGALSALVRLRDGAAGLDAFRAELAAAAGEPAPSVESRSDAIQHVRDVAAFEAACLVAFGFAALLAALVLIGQAIARYTGAAGADIRVLRALGMTRAQGIVVVAAGPLLAAIVGSTLGVAAAVFASQAMPFGAAAAAEPAPGIQFDALVLGIGWVLTPLLVLAAAGIAAWLSSTLAARRATGGRPSTLARSTAAAGLPVPVLIGTRFCLEPGRGANAVPVRPALIGAVVGVLGVIAAFTFASGVADAAANPERFGQTSQVSVTIGLNGQDVEPAGPVLAAVDKDPDVATVADTRYAVAASAGTSVLTFSYEPSAGSAPMVLTEGRVPTAADEVVLAPVSARRLAAQVGSTVPMTGTAGSTSMHVVGLGFVPQTDLGDYDVGGWASSAGYQRIFGGFFINHVGFVTLRSGADPDAVIPRILAAGRAAGGDQYLFVDVALVPRQFAEIQSVRVLPLVLGGFLALLAVGAIGHVLVSVVRRRRKDIAVLRALGMTRGQCRGIVITQASELAVIGLMFGIPLGLALGRLLWRLAAGVTPLQYVSPVALWGLVLIGPLALLLANLLAALPGRRATRLPVSQILRAE